MLDKILDTLTNPALVIAALVIGSFGEMLKRLIKPVAGSPGWRGVYYVTMPWHPCAIGLLVGLIPGLPTSTAFAGSLAGRVLFYGGAGGLAQIGYETLVSTIKRALEHKEAGDLARASVVPMTATRPKTLRGEPPPDDGGPGMGG